MRATSASDALVPYVGLARDDARNFSVILLFYLIIATLLALFFGVALLTLFYWRYFVLFYLPASGL